MTARTTTRQAAPLGQAVAHVVAETPVLGLSACLVPKGDLSRIEVVHHGVRNIGTGVPADDDTVYPIGSVTKLFTAFVIHQLVAEGVLRLDAPAADLLPDLWPLTGRDDAITVRHLLSHTAGLPDLFEEAADVRAVFARLGSVDVPASPLGIYSYSNSNYVVLGAIVEELTGRTWTDNVRDRLYAPLGLPGPLTAAPGLEADDHVSPGASDEFVPGEMWPRVGAPFEAAGSTVLASARDLAVLVLTCLTGRTPEGRVLLPAEQATEAVRQVVTVPGYGITESGWALGWSIEEGSPDVAASRRLVGHRGGTSALAQADPDDHTVLITLANSALGERAGRAIAQAVLGAPVYGRTDPSAPAPLSPAELDLLTGTYQSATFPIDVERVGDQLLVTDPMGGKPMPLEHCGGRSFEADAGILLSNVDFLGPDDGPAESVHLFLRNLPRERG